MNTKLPDVPTDGETRTTNRAAGWIDLESAAGAAEEASKRCGACGDPDGDHRLLLTVDWVDHLVDVHGASTPDEECVVPLCTRCRSWAEMLEIAEMNLGQHGRTERETIIDERNRFLESLRVRSISNFTLPEPRSVQQ